MIIHNTGPPHGCVLSPLLDTLYTYGCEAKFPSNSIFQFADGTTVVGQISNNDEIGQKWDGESGELVQWQ